MAAVGSQSWLRFSATLHILAGPKLKVKCELELPTAARATTATTATRENEHSWGFMSEHAKETGSDKGLEEQQRQHKEHARGGGERGTDGGGTVSSCCLGRRLTKYKSGGKSSGMQ